MMDLVSSLRMKKVRVIEIPKWGTYLRKQWEDNFVNHLSDKEKKSIYLYDDDGCCGYLWHVFSYERKNCLKEEQADIAFKKEAKQFCYVFYQHSDDALILKNASSLTAEDIVNEEDIYVVDKEFNWTYVKTMKLAGAVLTLAEKISEVKISESNGTGEMNEEVILSIKDKESLDVFEKAITTAVKQPGKVDISKPDYDVMVEYEADEGGLPTHGIHLWLGKENEKSTFMYITDDSIYLTSSQMTKKLRELILSKE